MRKITPGDKIGDYVVVNRCNHGSKIGLYTKNGNFVCYGGPGKSGDYLLAPQGWNQSIPADADAREVVPNFQFKATMRIWKFYQGQHKLPVAILRDVETQKDYDCLISELNPILHEINKESGCKPAKIFKIENFDITALWTFHCCGKFFGVRPVTC